MKNKLLLLIFLSIYILPCFQVSGQNSYERQIKYWYLRDRLRYFIVQSSDPLNDPGTYLPIASRNRNWEDNPANWYFTEIADYGQQAAGYGKYLGVLATEYYLLSSWGHHDEAIKTLAELENALLAYERLDLCEDQLDPPIPQMLDGFFIRHDVPNAGSDTTPNPFLVNSELNSYEGLLLQNDKLFDENGDLRQVLFINANMTPFNEYMSKDEAIFLLVGLALTYKFAPTDLKVVARDYADLLLNRMFGYVSPILHHHNWWIHDYLGFPISEKEGGDCRNFCFGLNKVAQDFFGLDGYWWIPPGEALWLYYRLNGQHGTNGHMIASIAAIGEGWGPSLTQEGIFNNTNHDDWDYYYLWLYKALWGVSSNFYGVDRIADRLDEAPCEGPWMESDIEHATHSWGSPDRWRYDVGEQCGDHVGNVGIYSGLDYMILLNLFYICNGQGLTEYRNRISCISDKDWPAGNQGTFNNPTRIEVFRDIISTDKLLNSPMPADVSYHAGDRIILNPGFKVKEGAHFNAKVEPLDYCSTPPVNHGGCYNKTNAITATTKDEINSYSIAFEGLNANGMGSLKSVGHQSDVLVYPNPSPGIFTLENVQRFSEYCVYSYQSRVIEHGTLSGESFKLDLSGQDCGLFYLVLQNEYETVSLKLSLVN